MLILTMLGASFLLIMVMMSVFWLIYFFRGNAGIVDVGWALGFLLVAFLFAVMGNGYWLRKFLISGMVIAWSARLFLYLLKRFIVANKEDARYTTLRLQFQGTPFENFYLMFLFQGLLIVLLSITFLIPSVNANPILTRYEWLGLLLWLIAIAGETIADKQLAEFKNEGNSRQIVCEKGLWYYSRHPNYFFEWLVWVSYFIFALSSNGGWIAILGPILILFLLTRVSGIPMTESEALITKGDGYRNYQRTTSVFVPWFKKK